MTKKTPITIGELYPNLSESELAIAQENLDRYLLLALRIFERVESESNPQSAALNNPDGELGYDSQSKEVSSH